jgi:hypothetical protein
VFIGNREDKYFCTELQEALPGIHSEFRLGVENFSHTNDDYFHG